jgi:AraC-like DNA-binding protein
VLSFRTLGARPEFAVTSVTCKDDHRNWSQSQSPDHFRVVLVRQGSFRRRTDGVCADLDPTVAYLGRPGEEEHFAHPVGGDVCTSVTLAPALWRAVAGDAPRVRTSTIYVDGHLDLVHRRILAAAGRGDVDYALSEQLVDLIRCAVTQVVAGSTPVGSTAADRGLVTAARAAIGDDHPAASGLMPLAATLGVSPYRLSRAFTREVGVSLTRYRNRVRVGRALDRLEDGEARLGVLAADLGFADQAHLCRTVRAHVGHTPTALRRLLAGVPRS